MSRLLTRAAAVAATAAATVALGASVASATTATPKVTTDADGNTVSVTFALESGQTTDGCVAVLTPASYATTLGAKFVGGDLEGVFTDLAKDENVILLKDPGFLDTPFVVLSPQRDEVTLTATDVPTNVYLLVTYCTEDESPSISTQLVGNPLEAISGSLGGFSSDGASPLDSLSAGGDAGANTGLLDSLSAGA